MNADARFAGSIPAVYERYMVPMFFQPYAADLAARFSDLTEGTLVEIAAGTGAVTRALISSLPATVRVVATDLNQEMLNTAATLAARPNLTWQAADARQLPFEAEFATGIACQFGVMFMPDKVGAYREARRILRPRGRYVFNVWNRLEQNEVTWIAARAIASMFPSDPPRFMERTPFAYFDPATIRRELESAGFGRIDIETVDKCSIASSPEDAAIGLCKGTPLRSEIEARDPARLDEAIAAVTRSLRARFGSGSFENQMSALVVSALP